VETISWYMMQILTDITAFPVIKTRKMVNLRLELILL